MLNLPPPMISNSYDAINLNFHNSYTDSAPSSMENAAKEQHIKFAREKVFLTDRQIGKTKDTAL